MLREPRSEREIRKFEGALLDIGNALPSGVDARIGPEFALMQAHRGLSLHRGLLALLDGPSLPSLFVLARPLVEIGITTAWVLLDPERRVMRWGAEQERRDLQLITDMRGLGGTAVDWDSEEVRRIEAEKTARIAEVRQRARVPSPKPLVPNLLDMAQEVGTGEAIEAYRMGYRSLSPWTHSNDAAFRFNFPDRDYVPDAPPSENPAGAQLVRLFAISLTAWILEVAGTALERDDIAGAARSIIEASLAAGQLSKHRGGHAPSNPPGTS